MHAQSLQVFAEVGDRVAAACRRDGSGENVQGCGHGRKTNRDEVEEVCNLLDDDPAGCGARGSWWKARIVAGEVAVGEFADALRTQIGETRAALDAARATKDVEAMTPHLLRLRYLLDIAAENGVEIGGGDAAAVPPPAPSGEE